MVNIYHVLGAEMDIGNFNKKSQILQLRFITIYKGLVYL